MGQTDPRGTHAAIQNIMKWAQRPEWTALHEQVLEEHVADALDEHGLESRTIPMLGGKTPRQAAQDEEGREQLVRLLKDLENSELRSARTEGTPAYDSSWIWRELGLQANAA
jgi:hypothetical protein